jgi:G3E family GTPase
MSLKFFKKRHKYETQADLKDLSAEQIVRLNPSDISKNIENETGGVPLTGVKKRAMFNILSQKNVIKKSGLNPEAREKVIKSFLVREGLKDDPEVSRLVVETNTEVVGEKAKMKEMENRLRKLNGQTEIPYTHEEQMYLRMEKLRTGGRTKKRRSRGRTKKRKNKKRRTHKKK